MPYDRIAPSTACTEHNECVVELDGVGSGAAPARTGTAKIEEMHMPAQIDQLEIERETLRRLTLYTRSIDTRDWASLSAVFADECVKERIGEEGVGIPSSQVHGGREIIADLARNLGRLGPTQHLLGNHSVELVSDEAESRTYVRAFHRGAGERRALWFEVLGEYRLRWRRLPEGWRVVRWSLRMVDTLGDPEVVSSANSDDRGLGR
jgi:hypothetical protein